MKRFDIINKFIERYNFTDYLEIGVFKGICFKEVKIKNKIGVDPGAQGSLSPLVTHKMTSDEFFKKYNKKFDIVFIDGLHHSEQVKKDIDNSLRFTKENGMILLHDCNPPTKEHAAVPRIQVAWNGDVYKAVLDFQKNNTDFEYYTVNTDWGVGVINKNNKPTKILEKEQYQKGIDDWDFFNENRNSLLNLISVTNFNEMFY